MSVSRFTPEARGHLVSAVRAGLSLPDACREIELAPDTAKGWMARGRRESQTDYSDFADQVEAARTAAQARPLDEEDLVALLERAARRGSVRATALLLSRLDRAAQARPPGTPPEWEEIYGPDGSRTALNPLDQLDHGGDFDG